MVAKIGIGSTKPALFSRSSNFMLLIFILARYRALIPPLEIEACLYFRILSQMNGLQPGSLAALVVRIELTQLVH